MVVLVARMEMLVGQVTLPTMQEVVVVVLVLLVPYQLVTMVVLVVLARHPQLQALQ
jgi:hypothetical protein